MSFFKRLFGIPETHKPANDACWTLSGNEVHVFVSQAPELSKPGGALRLEGKGLTQRLLLFRGDDGELHAFHNKCACAGWRLDPQVGTSTVQCCTLGKSTYDYSGAVISGSAKGPVNTYPVRIDDDKIVIELVSTV